MSTGSRILEQFANPAIVGAIAYFGAMALGLDGTALTPLGSVSIPVFYAGVSALGSVAGESLKQWVLPMINSNDLAVSESALLSPILGGAFDAAAFYMLVGTDVTNSFLIGAGSNILGTYAYDNFIKPYSMGL